MLRHDHDLIVARGERRRLAAGEFVDADDDLLAGLDRLEARGIGFDQLALHVADLDRRGGAAEVFDLLEFGFRLCLQFGDLARDLGIAVEDVAIFQEVGLVSHDLLHAQRPLLVEGPRQAERLVPGRELHGAGAGVLGEHHGEHLDQDAVDVVFRLLLGEAQRIDLHAIAEAAKLFVLHAVALARDLLPKLGEGAHFAKFGDEAHAGVDEEGDAADDLSEVFLRAFPATSSHRREWRRRWRAHRRAPATASRPLPADGRSRRSSD